MFQFGRFGRNVVSNSGANAVHAAMQLGLICLLFRWLNDVDYAAFLMAGYLIGLLEIASDYGGRLWATREFAVTESAEIVLRHSFALKGFYTLAGILIFSFLPFATLSPLALGLCVLIGFTQPGTDPFLWQLRGHERLDIEAAVVLAARTSIVIAMAVAAWFGGGMLVLLAIWLIGNVTRMAFTFRSFSSLKQIQKQPTTATPDQLAQERRNPDRLSSIIGNVFPLGTALVLTCVFQRLSLYLLENHATTVEFNIYATAFKFVNTSGAIATAVFVSSFAALSRAIESNDRTALQQVIRRMLTLVTIFFLPVCLAGIWLIEPMAQFIPNRNVGQVATVLVLLMPGLYVSCVNMGLKYTLNAFQLNWMDVAAVAVGIVTLTTTTLIFAQNTNWWLAGAFGWFVGESVLLGARLLLLRSQQKHGGIPIAVITGSAAALAFAVWVQV